MRQWRLLLLLFALTALVSVARAAEKNVDDETVEGSANADNPDDEEFDGDQASGLPPDEEKPIREPEVPVVAVQPSTGAPVPQPTTVIIQSGAADSWSLDTTTLIILFGALLVVLLLIIIAVTSSTLVDNDSPMPR
ncbi:hypothetical protein M3Y99_00503300 [Aphelenchoides fujianensis]|nr:hypothetical protein M3Y99_00503300 [Aphelenchoides fujianensis]